MLLQLLAALGGLHSQTRTISAVGQILQIHSNCARQHAIQIFNVPDSTGIPLIHEANCVGCMEVGRVHETACPASLITISTELISVQVISLKIKINHSY